MITKREHNCVHANGAPEVPRAGSQVQAARDPVSRTEYFVDISLLQFSRGKRRIIRPYVIRRIPLVAGLSGFKVPYSGTSTLESAEAPPRFSEAFGPRLFPELSALTLCGRARARVYEYNLFDHWAAPTEFY